MGGPYPTLYHSLAKRIGIRLQDESAPNDYVYDEQDLAIVEPVAHIQAHPERYVGGGCIDGGILASRIVQDVLVATSSCAFAARADQWWLVGSHIDWLTPTVFISLEDYFARMVQFPKAGQNAFHAEVLLTAFATDVVVFGGSEMTAIKGHRLPPDEIFSHREAHPGWQRAIAFRI